MKFSRIFSKLTRSSARNHGRPDEAEPSSPAGTQAGTPDTEDRSESLAVTAGEAGTPTGPPPAGDAGAHHTETSAAGAGSARNTLNNPAEFSVLQLQRATNNFSRQQRIRKGIYAHVFRGRFQTGEIVAVKRLNRYEDTNEDYNQEIGILTRLPRHPNIIELVGFCAEGDERIIVYEFMPFGSLPDHLTRTKLFDPCLDWNARMRIAADVANGLYHVETHETRVSYDDLKPCDVLIGYGFHAKLSIFGRADWFTSTRHTSNAYKFGLVLSEIITGKELEDFSRPFAGYLELSPKFTKEKKPVKLADRKMKGQFPVNMLKRALELVSVCTNSDLSSLRLKMTVVVQAMHYLTSDPNAMVRWPWAGKVSENNPVVFTFLQLQEAINNFTSDKRGSSQFVSEGRLQCGQLVAIKRLKHENRNMVYDLEVHTLTRLRHPNIINLIGYCTEGEDRFVVYEFMRLGSLFDQLHARKPEETPLDWSARMKIGAGVANALNYLHNKARPILIYGDLEPSNILLANRLNPKISNFGIAKSALFGNQSPPTTSPYWAPERALTGRLTFKSDVYNFGMVLLDIITGHADKSYIPDWVRREDRCIELAADQELKGQFSADMVMKALKVVSRCVDEDPDSRPNMGDVLGAMNYLACDPSEMAWPVEFDLLPGVQLE